MEFWLNKFFVSATAALIFCANVKGHARKNIFATKWQFLGDIIGRKWPGWAPCSGRLSVQISNPDMTFPGCFWHENCIFCLEGRKNHAKR